MFISKSEKESMVEVSLNLGEKIMKLEYELNMLKSLLRKSPSWKWVDNLESRIKNLEKKPKQSPLSAIKPPAPVTTYGLKLEKVSSAETVIAKKRGRPAGSKAKRPKFPPKTPFELKKPLGRPKGSKNKAK